MLFFVALSSPLGPFRTLTFQVGRLLVCTLKKCWNSVSGHRKSQYSLSVLCHFVALAGCYVGGQFVITRNILSFSFLHHNCIGSPSEFKFLVYFVALNQQEMRQFLAYWKLDPRTTSLMMNHERKDGISFPLTSKIGQ